VYSFVGRGLLARVGQSQTTRHISSTVSTNPERDKLFKKINIEVRGHDHAVLNSYIIFVKNVCHNLEIEFGDSSVPRPKYIKWIQYALRSKFAKKKYKLHYETRTYIRSIPVFHLTGSTAGTFLEYIERNIPEGVGMKVSYTEIDFLPKSLIEM